MGSMARAAYGETLRCERCFTPYKVVGADNAPQKRLVCNECGYAQDVIVITREEPVTRWTLVAPDGAVKSFATQEELIEAVRSSDAEVETPREPPTPRLELVESERDLSKRMEDTDPGEYVSIKDVVVAQPVALPPEEPEPPPARVSKPPPLPPEVASTPSLTDPPLTLPLESLDPAELDSEPPYIDAELAPPSVRAMSVPPPVPKKKVQSEPPPQRKSDLPSKLTKTISDDRSDEELIKDAASVARSDPPPPAKTPERVDEKTLLSVKPAPKKSIPPPVPQRKSTPAPVQSKPMLPADEEPVARQAPQPEAQQRSLLLPLLVIGLVSVGAWYMWSNAKSNDTPVSTPSAEPTASAAPLPPPSAQPLVSTPRLVVSAAPSASATPSASTAISMTPAQPVPLSLPELLLAAGNARKKGDNAAAKDFYNRVLAQHPGNVEANAGLGSIARGEGDLATARASYEKALATSPGFYPAIIGLADTEWELGDRAAAQLHYQSILKMANTPPDRVRERAGIAEAPKPVPTSAPPDNDRTE
jgi:Tfp pilus assembly protein PilF